MKVLMQMLVFLALIAAGSAAIIALEIMATAK